MNAIAAPAAPAAPEAAGFDRVDIHDLAAQIADQASADLIQAACFCVGKGDRDWFDLRSCHLDDWAHVDRAACYLDRRGAAASRQMVRHRAFPNLVRFEDRQ